MKLICSLPFAFAWVNNWVNFTMVNSLPLRNKICVKNFGTWAAWRCKIQTVLISWVFFFFFFYKFWLDWSAVTELIFVFYFSGKTRYKFWGGKKKVVLKFLLVCSIFCLFISTRKLLTRKTQIIKGRGLLNKFDCFTTSTVVLNEIKLKIILGIVLLTFIWKLERIFVFLV